MRVLLALTAFTAFSTCNPQLRKVEKLYANLQTANLNNNWDDAAIALKGLNAIAPNWLEGVTNLATVEFKRGNVKEAVDVYRRAEKHFGSDGNYYLSYCAALLTMRSEGTNLTTITTPTSILSICTTAHNSLPGNHIAVEALGHAQKELNRPHDAIATYKRFLRLHGGANETVSGVIVASLVKTMVEVGADPEEVVKVLEGRVYAEGVGVGVLELAVRVWKAVMAPFDKAVWAMKEKAAAVGAGRVKVEDSRVCGGGGWRIAGNYSQEGKIDVTKVGEGVDLVHFKQRVVMSGNHGIVSMDCVIFPGSRGVGIDMTEFPVDDMEVEVVEVDEPVLSLITPGFHEDYASWILEALPRFAMAVDLFRNDPEFFDARVLVPAEGIRDYIDDLMYLQEFEFLDGKLMFFNTSATGILKKRYVFNKGLYLLDWNKDSQPSINQPFLEHLETPPPQTLHTTRQFMHSAVRKVYEFYPTHTINAATLGSMVFVTSVAFSNQHEVIQHLQNRFGHRVVFNNGRELLLEQAARFATARVVVGVEGDPTLMNFAFCQENAGLIVLPRGRGGVWKERMVAEQVFGGEVVVFDGKGVKDIIAKAGMLGVDDAGKRFGELTPEILNQLEDAMESMLYRVVRKSVKTHDEL
ncbi:hypothetical protein HDU98_001770 [Podochytrium sp. JEL0797]|nr:hypothetical protein HDU98_001770 [Podochytrium sp. JEL0797]